MASPVLKPRMPNLNLLRDPTAVSASPRDVLLTPRLECSGQSREAVCDVALPGPPRRKRPSEW